MSDDRMIDLVRAVRDAFEDGRRAERERCAAVAEAEADKLEPCAEAIGARRVAARLRRDQ